MLRFLIPRRGLRHITSTRNVLLKKNTSRFASSAANTLATEAEPSSQKVSLDRELPDPFADKKRNKKYFFVYAVGITVSCAIIFNYEKAQSPIINSVLYCLRRSEEAKSALGPNIGYASPWPWIWGQLNTVKGDIDVQFKVKGDKENAVLKFKAQRESKLVPFNVQHLYLQFNDGRKIDLREDESFDFEL